MLPDNPTLHSSRLLLRPLASSDVEHVFAYASTPGFFRFLDHVPQRVRDQYRLEDAASHIAELAGLARRGFPHWAIVPLDAGIPVGAIRFHPAADVTAPELGYGLGPDWWHRGYATEAGQAVLAWAMAYVPVIVARTAPDNAASQRVLGRLGFRPTGADGQGRLTFARRR